MRIGGLLTSIFRLVRPLIGPAQDRGEGERTFRPALEALETRAVPAPMQATFYVSPKGRDTNPGTFARPFLTPQRARDAVREVNADMSGEIHVVLRGGTYALAST